jgi:hypothetical protein
MSKANGIAARVTATFGFFCISVAPVAYAILLNHFARTFGFAIFPTILFAIAGVTGYKHWLSMYIKRRGSNDRFKDISDSSGLKKCARHEALLGAGLSVIGGGVGIFLTPSNRLLAMAVGAICGFTCGVILGGIYNICYRLVLHFICGPVVTPVEVPHLEDE